MKFILSNVITDGSSVDPFDFLGPFSVTNNVILRDMFASIYGTLTVVGTGGAVLSLMLHAVISLGAKKNPEKMAEFKTIVGTKLILLAILSELTSIFSLAKYLGDYFIG